MDNVKKLVDMVIASIGDDAVDIDVLRDLAKRIGPIVGCNNSEIEHAIEEIQSGMDISMEEGSVLLAEDHVKWVEDSRADIEWNYWNRYEQYLLKDGYPKPVVSKIGKISERILDSAGDPRKEGAWARKGMVIGDVQSGKTANYTAVLARAVDAGYKVIIVIAGIHNNLRSQTQSRIDEGLSGIDSTLALLGRTTSVGVGKLKRIRPGMASFTNTESDFNSNIASQLGIDLNALAGPVVFVIKKNKSTLTRLVDWLRANNAGANGVIKSVPMLLIDDEADNASVNTSKDPNRATTINLLIRELLNLFDQRAYVGYTATPFANIFIDHDSADAEMGDDLFPSDFIHSLDAPSNYMGASQYFAQPRKNLIYIDDMESVLPLKHKNHSVIEELPPSLKRTMLLFFLVRAIRIIRGQDKSHNSLLVNASRFTSVQENIATNIYDKLEEYRKDIALYYRLPEEEALKSATLKSLKDELSNEYPDINESWAEIQGALGEAVSPISVVTVNSASAEGLNYSVYENGRNVIAIGGFSLSRGLTLEGLSVSYFYRNSVMYDTLLQMARWFGYRPGYNDLCRVFISEDAADWYQHISEAADELRHEVKRMEANNLTPEMFGLKVKRHPDSLIVTARNKMRSAEKFTQAITLSEELIETHLLRVEPNIIDENGQLTQALLRDSLAHRVAGEEWYIPSGQVLYKGVPFSKVRNFLENFQYHEKCMRVQKNPLLAYIEAGKNNELCEWDLVVTAGRSENVFTIEPGLYDVNCRERVIGDQHDPSVSAIVGNKFRVGQATDEALGLTQATYDEIKRDKTGNVSGRDFRSHRSHPLLIIHPLDLLDKKSKEGGTAIYSQIIAIGISFPRAVGRVAQAEEYMVNTVWWKNFMQPDTEDDDENEEAEKED